MLVISRKTGESFVVTDADGRRLKVRLLKINRGVVKIGIDGPREFRITRDNAKRGGEYDGPT